MASAAEKVTCPECGGKGTVPPARYTEPDRVCPTCNGLGKVKAKEVATGGDES